MKLWSKKRKRHFSRCRPALIRSLVGQRHEIVKKPKTTHQEVSPSNSHPAQITKTSKSGSKIPKSGQTSATPHSDMMSMSPVTCRSCHVMSRHVTSCRVMSSCPRLTLMCTHVNIPTCGSCPRPVSLPLCKVNMSSLPPPTNKYVRLVKVWPEKPKITPTKVPEPLFT